MVLHDEPNAVGNLIDGASGIKTDAPMGPMELLKVREDRLGELSPDLVLQLGILIAFLAEAFSIIKRLVAESQKDDQVW